MKTMLGLMLVPVVASAGLVENPVEYDHEGTILEGYHVFDDAVEGKRTGMLIVHQWTGLTDYEKRRARMLAELRDEGVG